jgi:hypothetical protein
VAVDPDSPAPPTIAQPTIFVVSDSPAATGVREDDIAMSTGDGDDSETETDSLGEEKDLSSAATGLGKNP